MNHGFDIIPGEDIPAEITYRPGRKPIYPYLEVDVGQGFFVPGKSKMQMASCKKHWKKTTGMEYKTLNGVRDGVAGCFVERIK